MFHFCQKAMTSKNKVVLFVQLSWKIQKNIPQLLSEHSMESDNPCMVSVGIVGIIRNYNENQVGLSLFSKISKPLPFFSLYSGFKGAKRVTITRRYL